MIPLLVALTMYLIFFAPGDIKRSIKKRTAYRDFQYSQQSARYNGYIYQFMLCCYNIYNALMDARDNGHIGEGEEIDIEFRERHMEEINAYYGCKYSMTLEQKCMGQARDRVVAEGFQNHWSYQPCGEYITVTDPILGTYTKKWIRENETFTAHRGEVWDYDNMDNIKFPLDGRTGAREILVKLFDWNGRNGKTVSLETLIQKDKTYKAFDYFLRNGFDGTNDRELPPQESAFGMMVNETMYKSQW